MRRISATKGALSESTQEPRNNSVAISLKSPALVAPIPIAYGFEPSLLYRQAEGGWTSPVQPPAPLCMVQLCSQFVGGRRVPGSLVEGGAGGAGGAGDGEDVGAGRSLGLGWAGQSRDHTATAPH